MCWMLTIFCWSCFFLSWSTCSVFAFDYKGWFYLEQQGVICCGLMLMVFGSWWKFPTMRFFIAHDQVFIINHSVSIYDLRTLTKECSWNAAVLDQLFHQELGCGVCCNGFRIPWGCWYLCCYLHSLSSIMRLFICCQTKWVSVFDVHSLM